MEALEHNGTLTPDQILAALAAAKKKFPGWASTYTVWGPEGGWFFYDEQGRKMGFLPAPAAGEPYYPEE